MQTASSERYHAFDALRAAMMLLGVFLHSATAYATFPDVWWLKDPHPSQTGDALILLIHTFRLPVFFVMSGFFAALLVERRGPQGFLENRAARLGLPFLLGMLVLYPMLKISSVFAWALTSQPDAWAFTRSWLAQGKLERAIEPMHLWFLEILMWLCLAAAALAPRLTRALSAPWFRSLLGSPLAPVAWAALSFPTLLVSEFGMLDTPHNFAPNFHIVLAYAVFFVFGWGLYCHRESLRLLRRAGWGHVVASSACALLTFFSISQQVARREMRLWPAFLATAALSAPRRLADGLRPQRALPAPCLRGLAPASAISPTRPTGSTSPIRPSWSPYRSPCSSYPWRLKSRSCSASCSPFPSCSSSTTAGSAPPGSAPS